MNTLHWMRAAAALALLGSTATPAQERTAPLNETERAAHVLSRLTYGPGPGDVEHLVEVGVDAWLEEQLALPEDAGVESLLAQLPSLELSAREIYERYGNRIPNGGSPKERARARNLLLNPRDELMRATALRAVYGERQVAEVLIDFWRNHFNVSYTKAGASNQLITEWDSRVLRRHGLGDFESLLLATAHHPAMLVYLDNSVSKRPPTDQKLAEIERDVRGETGSREAGIAAAELASLRGVNENYARELLELHTFGVDNGYKQEDVVALAEILTGWTWSPGRDGTWEFNFNEGAHVPGSKRFLRQRIQGNPLDGQEEGEEVLRLLAGHRRTADFLATKLCRLLVRDDPSNDIVSAVSATLRKHDGELLPAVQTILGHPDFWDRSTLGAKIKTPQEFVYSALRATGASVSDWDALLDRLQVMNQPIYHCDDPTGWSDTAEAWLDPGILAQRWQFAIDLASDKIRGVSLPPYFFDELSEDVPVVEWSRNLVKRLLPLGIGTRTQYALDNLVVKNRFEEPQTLRIRMLALILGCPEFQRQ